MVDLVTQIGDVGSSLINGVQDIIGNNPVASAVAGLATGAVVSAGVGAVAATSSNKNSTRKTAHKSRARRFKHHKRIKHTTRGWAQDRRMRSKQKWELAYQRRKRKSHSHTHSHRRKRGVHYTKKGQPYIILKSGKARFVKK